MRCTCDYCGSETEKTTSHYNRAKKVGAGIYCNKVCAGLSRRNNKSAEQKKEDKRLYDLAYREKNVDLLKEKKAAWFQNSYVPVQAAIKRKKKMPYHVEYCRRPEYKKWKRQYDEIHRAKKFFGEFYESVLLLKQIDSEVSSRASKYDIGLENGTINKSQNRRREHERSYSNKS